MKKLQIGDEFSREDVYKIFDNGITKFKAGTGTWGIQGIVKIPAREKDYVFFVTYGQDKLGQSFDESIDNDGIIEWKSQKKMDLSNKHILNFINHNHEKDNIYLFYRTDKKSRFQFKGKLKYLSHDPNSSNPVIIKWEVLSPQFEYSDTVINDVQNYLKENPEIYTYASSNLNFTEPPSNTRKDNYIDSKLTTIDFQELNKQLSEIGLLGELIVLKHLESKFNSPHFKKLKESIVHASLVEGDGLGYDIRYIDQDGNVKYVEVKTTTKHSNQDFFVSKNEYEFSIKQKNNYELYRLYNLSKDSLKADCYRTNGSLADNFTLTPSIYSANYKK